MTCLKWIEIELEINYLEKFRYFDVNLTFLKQIENKLKIDFLEKVKDWDGLDFLLPDLDWVWVKIDFWKPWKFEKFQKINYKHNKQSHKPDQSFKG